MNRPLATLVPLAFAAVVLVPTDGFGQSRSMFGNSTSSATALGRSSNSSGFSGLTSSSASRGQMGMGQTGFGNTGMQSGFGQQSQFGATTGQRQGLLGGNQSGRLIGSNQAGGQQGAMQGNQFGGGNLGLGNSLGLGRRGANGGRGAGGLNQGGFGGGFGQQGGGGMSATGPRYPNPQLKVGFEPAVPAPAALGSSVSTRLARVDKQYGLASVTATIDESAAGTVVLSGTVRTPQERKKAEHLVRFEPGVRDVRNEIVVAGETAD